MSNWQSPLPDGFRISGLGYTDTHQAYDLAPLGPPREGDELFPLRAGTVVHAGPDTRPQLAQHPEWDRGLYVLLHHDDHEQSCYCHLRHLAVRTGADVTAAESIGTLGQTGYASGPHCHLWATRGGVKVDWLAELQAQPDSSPVIEVPTFTVGPGVQAAMDAAGDIPAGSETYVHPLFSLTPGRDALYVYSRESGQGYRMG